MQDDAFRIETAAFGDEPGQFAPGNRAPIGQVPDPGFAVDQQIERGIDKIRDISRGNRASAAARHSSPAASARNV